MPKTRRDADTYDAGGRVTRAVNGRGQVLDLSWNLQDELVSVSTNGAFAEGYSYDPMGRRIATTNNSGMVYHAYDGIHCVADLAPDASLLRSYTWGAGIDNLLAVTLYSSTETNTLYAVTAPLGTVHALVAADGVPAVTYAYDSWGNPVSDATSASLSNRFTWQGREYSRATGLYNFRARWYDPSTGRWLSKDPIGLEGGLNLYEAFGNNPVCFRDPEGDNPIIIVIGVAIIFSKVACYSAKKIESAKKVDTDDFYEVGNYLVDESCEFLNEVSPNPWLGTSPLKDGDLIEDAVKAPIWRPYWEENYRRPLKESIRRTKHQRR